MTEDDFRSQDTRGLKPLPDANTIRTKITQVTAVAASPGNAHADHYMRGMANGLLLAQSIANSTEVSYIEPDVCFDYSTEAEKTCTIVFNPQYVERDDLVETLKRVIDDAERMNLFKKLFFRGRTPAEVGFVDPGMQRSMGPLLEGASVDEVNIIHGIVGVVTEAGEMAELLLAFIEGAPFDRVHLLEEGGDVEWYQHRILRGIRATADVRDRANIDKLHGRHGEAFDVFRDANRDLGTERAKLEIAAAPLLEDKIVAGIEPRRGSTSDMVDRIAAAASTPRVRNDPPLPAGVTPANGGENIGDEPNRPIGDCEGLHC